MLETLDLFPRIFFLKANRATIHLDTKALQDLSGNDMVERLAVLLSQESGVQLLNIPKIENTTGETMAEAVFSVLIDWNAMDDVAAISFDTTNSNSGHRNGAVVLLERKLERSLLKLACRHHIYEVILKAVFDLKFGKTTAPTVPIFQRFRDQWSNIDQSKFTSGINDKKINDILDVVKVDIINFCRNELEKKHPRDDYKELLDLTIKFVGGNRKSENQFRQPGPMHHARWMAKAIYCLKIFMFASQFELTRDEKNALRDICLFVVRFYIKMWFQCTKPLQAPRLDLQFIKDIHSYRSIDLQTSDVVLKKLRTQSWYLSEEPIAFAFFDNDVTVEEKRRMVQSFNEQPEPNEETTMFRLIIPPTQFTNINTWHLSDFITENTRNFFTRYNISLDFLQTDPSEWNSIEEYKKTQTFLNTLQVTNDHAERALNLMKTFNRKMTKDEKEEQYILQIVSKHRKEDTGVTKSALVRQQEQD